MCYKKQKRRSAPDLHALAARAHVFPEQDAVDGRGSDQVEELSDHLTLQLRLHALLIHAGVEGGQLLQDGRHAEGLAAVAVVPVLVHAAGTLAEACGLHAGDALKTLVLQHSRNWRKRRRSMNTEIFFCDSRRQLHVFAY